MLADVVPLVRRLVPGLLRHPTPSVACISATHCKYLVFDADPSRPACVVEFGQAQRLQHVNAVLAELHPRMPGGVPRPLVCAPWRGDTYVTIQEGVAGMPWFRVADMCDSHAQWRALLKRGGDAMARLHAATADVREWVGPVNVAAEIMAQVRSSTGLGGTPCQ